MAKLERSALADLWKHTLSRIDSVYGRIVYLSSLRDTNSGIYRHYGLVATFGREESMKALRDSHRQVFDAWIALTLEEQRDDLEQYLRTLEDPQMMVIEHWLGSGVYRSYVPSTAPEEQTAEFYSTMEILLPLVKNTLRLQNSGVAPLDRGSSRPA